MTDNNRQQLEEIANICVNNYYSKYDKDHSVWDNEVPGMKESINIIIHDKTIIKFIRNFNNDDGFMFSTSPEMTKIQNLWSHFGHSGASGALSLRVCQNIFNKMFNEEGELIYKL